MSESENLPAVHKAGTALAVHNAQDDARFDRVMREAEAVYHSTFLPATLTKKADGSTFLDESAIKANCVVVANVAHDMGVGFMAVAQSMSSVHGKLMFEGKLIAAVIEQRLGVRLRKTYTGEPGTDSYGIKVWTKVDAEEGFEPIDGTVGEWKTKERSGAIKGIWVGANKQKNQLFYMGARVWARLNAPGLMLGILGDDEVDDAPDVAPAAPKMTAGFAQQDAPQGAPAAPVAAPAHPVDKPAAADAPKVDEKQAAPAESSTEGKKTSTRKAKKVDEKPAVSENLAKALAAAREEIDQLFPRVCELHPDDKPELWAVPPEQFPVDNDAAQEMLGRFNASIDVMKRDIETVERSCICLSDGPFQSDCPFPGHAEKATAQAEEQRPAPPPPPPPAPPADQPTPAMVLASLNDVLRPLTSWLKIKETFHGFARLGDWKAQTPDDKSRIYAMVWGHANRVNVAETGQGNPPQALPDQDPTAYRCALEAVEDREILRMMWAAIQKADTWKTQSEGTRKAVEDATNVKLKKLGA